MKHKGRNEVVCLGEALVDFISMEPGKSISGTREWRVAPGGAVCNVAVGLARLGVKVGLITKLGMDPFGEFMLGFLKREGVGTSLIKITEDELTALVFVALDRRRNPSFFFYGSPGADRMLEPEEINADFFKGVKVFHFGTISLSMEPVRSATMRAVDLAKRAGARLSFDPNLRFHLWKDKNELRRISLSIIPKVDLVKLNEDELLFLTGADDFKKGADMVLKKGVKIVVVTLGERGAFFATRDSQGLVPGFRLKPVDTTGAGDAFCAGMIYSFIRFRAIPPERAEMIEALRFANAFAGLSTLELGAIDGLKGYKDVLGFLKSHQSY